jgi:hypothetical protein
LAAQVADAELIRKGNDRRTMMAKAVVRSALGRRQFLRVLGIGASVAATAPVAAVAIADSEPANVKRKSRYRESEHIKTFYSVNRYPS